MSQRIRYVEVHVIFKSKGVNTIAQKCANVSVIASEFQCECQQGNRAGWWDDGSSCVTVQGHFLLSQKELQYKVMSFHI